MTIAVHVVSSKIIEHHMNSLFDDDRYLFDISFLNAERKISALA